MVRVLLVSSWVLIPVPMAGQHWGGVHIQNMYAVDAD